MSLDADLIVDRRRMRRKLTFWRVVTVLVAIVAVVGAGVAVHGNRGAITGGPGGAIARINIEGLIRGNRQRTEALKRLANSNAKAVIVHINSPGGTVAGSEELYDSLIKVKAKKPMVVVVDGLAASGGYIAAMASDHIVAQQSAIVGSIGVHLPVSQCHRASEDDRRPGRDHQVLAAEGRARAAMSRPAPRRAPPSRPSSRTPTTGSRAWCATAGTWTMRCCRRCRTAGCSPAGRRSSSS